VQDLLDELTQVLRQLTGDGGTNSFHADDLHDPHAVLLVARDAAGHALGCGALRPLEGERGRSAEVKRMYARSGGQGVGSAVLEALERHALGLGCDRLVLSTRRINAPAVAFYRAHGYVECKPYGRYVGREVSICLGKALTAPA
jgi:ribosomal protein S18 acetylase RimI-like enzyme